jgi:hypothetical protein
VTVLERDVLPPPGKGRTAVPRGRHVHALLPGGLAAIEQLLPGFQAELVAGGAVTGLLAASGVSDHVDLRLPKVMS